MNNSNNIKNNDFPFISMEMAGVSYVMDSVQSNINQFITHPVVINYDFNNKPNFIEENFNPSIIVCDNHFYYLTGNLNCKLSFVNNNFIIECSLLKIKVFGKTKEDVINAFNFSFHALFINFAKESDNKLSASAKDLKAKLKELVS